MDYNRWEQMILSILHFELGRHMNPTTRAKRILAKMGRFRQVFGGDSPSYLPPELFRGGEVVIGVYENVVGQATNSVVITDQRLLIEDSGNWSSADYARIDSINVPEPNSVDTDSPSFALTLMDKSIVYVPIRGCRGHTFDLYEFSRFLLRVVADLRVPKAQKRGHHQSRRPPRG